MWTRNLKRYMSGDDVLEVKNKLVELGYLAKATHNRYGNDTYKAVKAFQSANNLEADGIVGQLTWAAMFPDSQDPAQPESSCYDELPTHIGEAKRRKIAADLDAATEIRKRVCMLALSYATDPDIHGTLKCFYIRGGNLFNKDLSCNLMTQAKLKSYFSRTAYAPYYDNGRQEMMEEQAASESYTIAGADCSGTVVGIWRRLCISTSGFDAAADGLYKNYCTKTTDPQPGDLAWRSGHIGIYVGGGYICECLGGEYGLQLTLKSNRRAWSYTRKKLIKMGAWTAFGDPKWY